MSKVNRRKGRGDKIEVAVFTLYCQSLVFQSIDYFTFSHCNDNTVDINYSQ